LNADDPIFFGVGVLDEYERTRVELCMTDVELAEIATASIAAARLPESVTGRFLERIAAWLCFAGPDASAADACVVDERFQPADGHDGGIE
jgi:adenosine deaminase